MTRRSRADDPVVDARRLQDDSRRVPRTVRRQSRDARPPSPHSSEDTMSYQGESFIKHEFNEAIAIQEAIVEAERELSENHPLPEAQKTLKDGLKNDERQLKELQ